jgi:hypothetical protein
MHHVTTPFIETPQEKTAQGKNAYYTIVSTTEDL